MRMVLKSEFNDVNYCMLYASVIFSAQPDRRPLSSSGRKRLSGGCNAGVNMRYRILYEKI